MSCLSPFISLYRSLKVCQGLYDPVLIEAWERWDDQHVSENDHPRAFPDNQVGFYIIDQKRDYFSYEVYILSPLFY